MSDSPTLLRVLYIDDDEMALTLTQLQLLRVGIHTETTSDVLEAVGILTTQEVDLILLDSVMPSIDGVEFLQLIRSLHMKHPVVFFTGHGTEGLRELTREFDVLDILDKQVDRFHLAARLRALHAAHVDNGVNPLDSFGAPRAAS